jgi:putative NADH-flavin reductase
MEIFLLGATGGIGRHLVKLALDHGHSVTAFARSPEKLGITHQRLRAVQGDLFDAEQMARSVEGHDAVLSSFGPATLKTCTLRRDFGRTRFPLCGKVEFAGSSSCRRRCFSRMEIS